MGVIRTLALLAALAFPAGVTGQATVQDPPRRVDAEVMYLTFSWIWPVIGTWGLGPELGAGILEQKTIRPAGDDLTPILHFGLTASGRVAGPVGAEFGFRLGGGELRSSSCSGCLPDGFRAGTAALFVGFRRVRFGSRYMLGTADGQSVRAWSPLIIRFQF